MQLAIILSFAAVAWADTWSNGNTLDMASIPLTVDGDGRYCAWVAMSGGANKQNFTFGLTTSTGYTAVAGRACGSGCNGVTSFDQSQSTTAVSLPASQNIQLPQGNSASGNLIREDCALKQAGPHWWSYENQTILIANQSDSIFGSGTSGLLGLGTNARSGQFEDSIVGKFLSLNPSQTNFTYGMALTPPNEVSSNSGGTLHLGGASQSHYQAPSVAWKNLLPYNGSALDADFQMDLDGWTATSDAGTLTRQSGLIAIVDPYYTTTIFPQTEATLLYSTIKDAQPVSDTSTSKVWSIPCDTQISMALHVGDQSFTIDQGVLIKQLGGRCYGTIEGWKNETATEYLLGSNFISNTYMILVLSNANNGRIGFAKRATSKSSSSLSTGAIIGIAVGQPSLFSYWPSSLRQRKADTASNGKAEWDKELPATPSVATNTGGPSTHSHTAHWVGNYNTQPLAWQAPKGSPTEQPLLATQDSPSLYTPSTQSSFTPGTRPSYVSTANGANPVVASPHSSPNPPRSPTETHSPVSAQSGVSGPSVHSPPPMYNTNPIRVVERLSRPPAPVLGMSAYP
ncbi:acid protease [Hymenopellis radicata]|nr:acid protease [Hymenopellis radicata]